VNFTQNESQRELAALSRRILTDRLTPERLAGAEAGGDGFDPALWASLAGAGILAAGLPESVGGAGLGLLEQCSVLTELGRAVAPVPYLASIVLGASALAAFGTPDQQRRWAAPAGRGELILTAALPEEDGDDPRAPSARAERVTGDGEAGGGWWLESDNPAAGAVDSNHFGPVPEELIVARVLFRYWRPRRVGSRPELSRTYRADCVGSRSLYGGGTRRQVPAVIRRRLAPPPPARRARPAPRSSPRSPRWSASSPAPSSRSPG
jgi:hypothetical protein